MRCGAKRRSRACRSSARARWIGSPRRAPRGARGGGGAGRPGDVPQRVAEALRTDPDAGLQARAVEAPREAAAADAVWQDALEGRLPDTPADLRDVLTARGGAAPLGVLQKLVDAGRQREGG